MKHERNAVKTLNEWGQVSSIDIINNYQLDIYIVIFTVRPGGNLFEGCLVPGTNEKQIQCLV